ncbi:hypothetical protein ACJJTC_014562 [Scirpophaga incertulas]
MPPKKPMKTPISTRRRTATRRCQEQPMGEASSPSPSMSRKQDWNNEGQSNTKIPSLRENNVGSLPTLVLPPGKSPENYPMPTITVAVTPRTSEAEVMRQMRKDLPFATVHTTRGGTHVHFNSEDIGMYMCIWEHLTKNKVNIIRLENHEKRTLHAVMDRYVSSASPQPQETTTPRDASPARTPTPLLSANASRDGSPTRTPTPTPQYEYVEQDALPPRTPTPNVAETTLEPSPTPEKTSKTYEDSSVSTKKRKNKELLDTCGLDFILNSYTQGLRARGEGEEALIVEVLRTLPPEKKSEIRNSLLSEPAHLTPYTKDEALGIFIELNLSKAQYENMRSVN